MTFFLLVVSFKKFKNPISMRTLKFLLQKEFKQIFRNKALLPMIFVVPISAVADTAVGSRLRS
jgi:hypothetical protein